MESNFTQKIKNTFGRIEGIESAILYGSATRGDFNPELSDIDVTLFVKKRVTDVTLYENLSKINPKEFDIAIHSIEDIEGVICSMFDPGFYAHWTNNYCIAFDNANIVEKVKSRGDIWNKVEEKTENEIRAYDLAALSYRLLKSRRYSLKIQRFLPKYGTEILEDDIKSFRTALSNTIRDSLDMNNIHLCSQDSVPNIIEAFFEMYSADSSIKSRIYALRSLNPLKLNDEGVLSYVHESRKIIETLIGLVNSKVCEQAGI